MTSEPDSTPRRRPPTIDLTATEIKTEQPAAESGETAQAGSSDEERVAAAGRSEDHRARELGPYLVGSLGGAVVVAAIVAALWFGGVVPGRSGSPATADTSASNAISAQLNAIQSELKARPAESALPPRVAAIEAQQKALSDSLAALNRRLDDVAASAKSADARAEAASKAATGAAQSATASANAANGAAQSATAASSAAKTAAQGSEQAAQGSVQRSDVDALAARIATLENSIKTLSAATTREAASADDHAARAAVAAEALRGVVERGVPYEAELNTMKSFGADQNDIAALQPLAATGVPSTTELAHELSQLTASMSKTLGPAKSDGSFLGRLENHASGLVSITPVDAPAGNGPAAVIGRLNADAAHDDIAAALTDIGHLPASLHPLAAPWVQKANARNAAIAASQRIAASALAGLGTTNTQ